MPSTLVLTGPTAVGKTALSLLLAERLQTDIISADSRQVYKHLDIGTAKPTPAERARVRHHLIDCLNLEDAYSAGRFAEDAHALIDTLLAKGRPPLVVGGSTLYLHALMVGLADIPPIPHSIRERLIVRLDAEGSNALFRELERIDPAVAASMDATKSQRIVRALEVYYGTGTPLSTFQAQRPDIPYAFTPVILTRRREHLYERIEQRVDQMLDQGLVAEVEGLLKHGYDPVLAPLRTIGYQEPIDFLQGQISYDEMVRLIKRNTRRYAKRQLTWFRRYHDAQWINLDQEGNLTSLADHMYGLYRKQH